MPEVPTIEFDAETHTYTVAGRVLPSVTQILKAVGCIDDRWYTEDGRTRGEIIDKCTELYDKGELDVQGLAYKYPHYNGYVEAWARFRKDTGFNPLAIQERMVNLDDGYAGTADRTGTFAACSNLNVLIDIKTGAAAKWHPLQTRAYAWCDHTCDWIRGCVYLGPDGKYKWVEHTNPNDGPAWDSVLNVYKYLNGAQV